MSKPESSKRLTYLLAFDRVYLSIGHAERENYSSYHLFKIDDHLKYHSFCLDFGPMNLSMLFQFRSLLHSEIQSAGIKKLALVSEQTAPSITNAVLFLGSYMIMELDCLPSDVEKTFAPISKRLRSMSAVISRHLAWAARLRLDSFGLLGGLTSSQAFVVGPFRLDCEEYDHFDSPLNADLHVIVPNKIVAMKGPVSLPDGNLYSDPPSGGRNFSPTYMSEILADLNVKMVVRLNQPKYTAYEFEAADIAVADLFFEDCSLPSDDIAVKFLLMVENLPGAAAVHCKAGLGRTGTLIGLYLMKNFFFSARQAIVWLRLVRPGSVIGRQQHYLCSMEDKIARLRGHPMSGRHITGVLSESASSAGGSCSLSSTQATRMIASVHRRVDEGAQKSRAQTILDKDTFKGGKEVSSTKTVIGLRLRARRRQSTRST